MTLAVEHVVEIGPERITLRPSLCAAIRLDRKHGLKGLVTGITDGSLSVIGDVIRESAPAFNPGRLLEIGPDGLGLQLGRLVEPLLAHVLALYGIDPKAKQTETQTKPSRPVSADPFGELFAIATGTLGWSSAQAYAASPAEIIAAHKGRVRFVEDILGAVWPSADKPADGPDDSPLDRDGLAELAAM